MSTLALPQLPVIYGLSPAVNAREAIELYKRVLDDLLAGHRAITLNCAAVRSIDTQALERFKELGRKVLEVRGVLVFEHVHEDVWPALARFDGVFEVRRAVP